MFLLSAPQSFDLYFRVHILLGLLLRLETKQRQDLNSSFIEPGIQFINHQSPSVPVLASEPQRFATLTPVSGVSVFRHGVTVQQFKNETDAFRQS